MTLARSLHFLAILFFVVSPLVAALGAVGWIISITLVIAPVLLVWLATAIEREAFWIADLISRDRREGQGA